MGPKGAAMLSRFVVAVLCVLVTGTVALADQAGDLSDDAVLRRINQGRSPESLVSAQDIVLRRPEQFPGVVLVGYRKANSAFLLGTVFVDGEPLDPPAGAAAALAGQGWAQADADQRARLARQWVEHAVLAFGDELLETEPRGDFDNHDFDTPGFREPEVRTTVDGSVRLTAWIREAPGHDLGTSYRRSIFLFSADGRLARTKMLDRFYLPPQ